jgi:hypothetical protein
LEFYWEKRDLNGEDLEAVPFDGIPTAILMPFWEMPQSYKAPTFPKIYSNFIWMEIIGKKSFPLS